MKKLLSLMMALILMVALIGCDKKTTTTTTKASTAPTTTVDLANIESNTGLDRNVVAEIDIVLWSGDGSYLEDMGHKDYTPDDLLAQNNAAAYAVSKAFNEIYPNVKINGYFKSGDPGALWNQVLETYRDDTGRFPALWASVDLSGDVARGIVADISRFEDDPLYQQLNPSIMAMMNYYGFQAGLPQYILPWGVYVNKSLADANGIEVPNYDWDIDEYTDFTANYSNDPDNQYYGAMDTPLAFINTGTTTIRQQMLNYTSGTSILNINSDEVRSMIGYIHEWVDGSFWGNYDKETLELGDNAATGPVHSLYTTAGSWDYHMFRQGRLLTLEAQPWMMGDCAEGESNPDWWAACNIDDWDIYPRPATDYQDTTIGLVLDPMAIYNYCIQDNDLSCSAEEELMIQVAYTFAIFWCADSRSFAARAAQTFYDATSKGYSSALNDSMPIVKGEMFDAQMEHWYTPTKHQRFGATNGDGDYLMPGFQEVLRIYQAGEFWDVSDKAFPWYYSAEGTRQDIQYEWQNYWDAKINGGKAKFDADFESSILSLLPTWNTLTNERYVAAFNRLRNGLKTYYGYQDSDFE